MPAGQEARVVDVDEGDWADVVVEMVERSRDRAGWITLEPLFDTDEAPQVRSSLLDLFSGRGPPVPDLSWVPGEQKGDRVLPTSIGVRHPSGARAAGRLAAEGHAVPDSWRVVQDHPKRGLVVELPEDERPDAVLDWLVRAAHALSTVPLSGRWRAYLYSRLT